MTVQSVKVPVSKTEKSRKKRELILRAAARVFTEKGYAQTTLSDIAALADTYSGSMYYYFPSKDHLVEEVLNIGTTSVSEVVIKRVSKIKKGICVVDRLRIALESHLGQMLKRDDFIVAYWKIIDQVPAEIRERHNRMPRIYGQFWLDLIKEGQASGELRDDLDPNIVRLLLVGSSIYSLMWYHEEGRMSVEQIANVLIQMFFYGMTNKPVPAIQAVKSAVVISDEGRAKPVAAKRSVKKPKSLHPPLARSVVLADGGERVQALGESAEQISAPKRRRKAG
jgi:AcrR family transcriptional regulator